MIKKIIFLFLIFLNALLANEKQGLVLVLEAPIFQAPDRNSQLIQLKRKGDLLYIHPRHFLNSPVRAKYYNYNETNLHKPEISSSGEEFYETLDRNGNQAYIPKSYVKLLYRDHREFSESITPYKIDPTDYRLEEPLPETFPLIRKEKMRSKIVLSYGPALKKNYAYNEVIEVEDFSSRYGFEASYGKKASWDKYDRFYFGANFHLWTSQGKFSLFDGRQATESNGQIGIGPYVSYDIWKGDSNSLAILGSLTLNYNRIIVSQYSTDGRKEERIFSGTSISPKISLMWTKKNVIADLDFIGGTDYQIILPHQLTSKTPAEVTDFWQESESESWNVAFSGQMTLFAGFRAYY